MKPKLNTGRFRGFVGNCGVALLVAGLLDRVLAEGDALQSVFLILAGVLLIALASLEGGK